jgi:signal recognition particle GTPase
MSINEKLSKIQAGLKAKKSKFNSFGKYNYRSAEDILEAIKPFLLEHDVTVTINETVEELGGMIIMNSTGQNI